ncbi:alpha/beta hydrolase [Caulobacter flavus]|uniref:Alpha/beta hydrolase n=1 Tax=Caulobacter flavus TaxID=1679497 RepID=A0A2N5D223_9CAUL|nr:alpha/beta fold hydrolase [Caulobacter flavus]AYV46822.1 alpha/beta hydrolase [Caulobacter flavus]PLR20036.1 alpha/beta hydrolase [Caulobacter flavus]
MTAAVMLIHGAWLTPRAWDRFKARYEAQGMTVVAPAWPLMDAPVEGVRGLSPRALGRLTLEAVVEAHAAHAVAMVEPPILIGHGLGGLVVQRLLDGGCGACGVAIASTPPLGLLARPRAAWALRRLLARWNGAAPLSPEGFADLFAHTLPEDQRRLAYAEHVVPAPARVLRQALLGPGGGAARAARRRPPLLLIAGDEDRMAPPAMVAAAARHQRRAASRTDLQCFSGRSHWLCNEPGWEDVADFALDWALANGRAASPATRAALPGQAPKG